MTNPTDAQCTFTVTQENKHITVSISLKNEWKCPVGTCRHKIIKNFQFRNCIVFESTRYTKITAKTSFHTSITQQISYEGKVVWCDAFHITNTIRRKDDRSQSWRLKMQWNTISWQHRRCTVVEVVRVTQWRKSTHQVHRIHKSWRLRFPQKH